jgi:predicted enzyme related to lactoylglutathione lyase
MQNKIGTIGWHDLTVKNAEEVRDFYSQVAGWQSEEMSMGEYSDYVMKSPDGNDAVGGICHARGVNAALPSVWLVYITVEDLQKSMDLCKKLGGSILIPPKSPGAGNYAIIKDPAGAVCALYQG